MGFRDTHGFPIDSSMALPKMMAQASGRRSLECLRFAAEMGATWSITCWQNAGFAIFLGHQCWMIDAKKGEQFGEEWSK